MTSDSVIRRLSVLMLSGSALLLGQELNAANRVLSFDGKRSIHGRSETAADFGTLDKRSSSTRD